MKRWLIIWSVAALLSACSDEDFRPSILDTTEENRTELDNWIMKTFTGPHNIEIIYQWDDYESNQEYNLVPPSEDKVQAFLEVIKQVWVEPYMEVAGASFFSPLCPKQIMLVGSPGYNTDGTYLMGEAAGGNKITMYNLNYDNPKSANMVNVTTHNFHHEFCHILHQTVEYPEAFSLISGDAYTSSWQNETSSFAKGCISKYAMADADEDFAEMVAYFVHSTATQWSQYMNSGGAEGSRKLKEKETIILNYMQSIWGINLHAVREKVLAAMLKVQMDN